MAGRAPKSKPKKKTAGKSTRSPKSTKKTTAKKSKAKPSKRAKSVKKAKPVKRAKSTKGVKAVKGRKTTKRAASTRKAGGSTKAKSGDGIEGLPLFDAETTADTTTATATLPEPEAAVAVLPEPVTETPAPRRSRKTKNGYQDAHSIARRQREISISEFFAKNRHLLGFDSLPKALLTAVKEAVDNSLDACEEAGLLPNLLVEIKEIGENRYTLCVEDSGPGIVKSQVPRFLANFCTVPSFMFSSRPGDSRALGFPPP